MDADRLQSLFSEYERVIRGQTESRRRSVSAHHGDGTLEPECPEPQQQMLSEAITAHEQPPVTQPRLSQRRRKATPRAAVTAQHHVQKKRVSTSSHEHEFLRLAEARKASNGSIEYKVMWKPTWVTVEDLRGERAFEEAEELVVNEFDHATWKREVRKSGYLGTDSETE